MLSIIADGFDPTFAQVSLVSGDTTNIETAILTVDPAGHFAVFYQPNTELGYINPATGDLLTLSQFPGTSNVSVLDAVVGGNGTIDSGLTNVSQLAGLHYANGQIIASNGGLTLFHEDGSSLRSGTTGATWTYDGGANFITFSINYNWSNTRVMKSSGTYRHPNSIIVRNTSGSIFYAANTTFYNNSTGEEFYPASLTLRNTAGVYSYETGAQLDNSNVIYYPSGATMIAANGNVFNADGSPATTPFSQHDTFTNSEVTTTVSNGDYAITIAAKQTVSGSPAAYVTRIHPIYPVSGDYNVNGHVDAADYVLWRKNLTSVTPLPNDNGLGTPIGQAHYALWRANFGQTAPAPPGAGAGVGQALPDSFVAGVSVATGVARPESATGVENASSAVIATPFAEPQDVPPAVAQAVPDNSPFARHQLQPDLPTSTTHFHALLAWLSARPAPIRNNNDNTSPTSPAQIDSYDPNSDCSTATIDDIFESSHVLPSSPRLRASA